MNWIVHLSLLSGPLPTVVTVTSFVVLAGAVVGARPRWQRDAAVAWALTLLSVLAAGQAIGIEHRVGSTFPTSFFLWAAFPVFAIVWTAWCWKRTGWRQRTASIGAVALTGLFAAICVNSHYAYWPTVGDEIGRPVHDEVTLHQLAAATDAANASTMTITHGAVISVDIPGTTSGFQARPAMVWLPPVYLANPRARLPVMVVLAGVPGDPTNMIRAGHASEIADAYAVAHHGTAPILVFPDHNGGFLNDSECVDGPRGHVESYLLDDVARFVETRFNAAGPGPHWGIVGFSEGGTCAVTLGLRHPDRFAGFVDIAGDLRPNAATGPHQQALTVARLYGGDARQWYTHDPLTLLATPMPHRPTAIFAAGDQDHDGMANAQMLQAATRRAGLPTFTFFVPGGHTFITVQRVLPDVFPVLADRLFAGWSATAKPATAT